MQPPNTHLPAAPAGSAPAGDATPRKKSPRKAAPPSAAESYAELARKLAGLTAFASDANAPAAAEASEAQLIVSLPFGSNIRDSTYVAAAAPAPAAPPAASTPAPAPAATQQAAEPAPTRKTKRGRGKPTHGGWRPDSGRKPLPDQARKQAAPAYVHLTPGEKADVEAKAGKAKLSISAYIREKLGYSVG